MSVLYRSNSSEQSFSMGEHIAVYDNFFSKELCQKFIDYFEYRSKLGQKRNSAEKQDTSVNFGTETAMREECTIHEGTSDECLPEFMTNFWEVCFPMYLEKHPQIEKSCARLEMSIIKLQKTLPSQGYHIWHCEHGNRLTGSRMAFVILYLNDVLEGGETEFLYQSARVQPSAGRLIIAPASYTHVHRGNPPLSGEKYILTTWLEFRE